MLWIKAIHLIGVISWMAQLLYLPRLFVNWAEVSDAATRERLILMMRRLRKLGHVAMAITFIFGAWLLWRWVDLTDGYFNQGWLHIKLFLVATLIAYQVVCGRIINRLSKGNNAHSAKWYRWFNEVPAIVMIGIIILVVVKPF